MGGGEVGNVASLILNLGSDGVSGQLQVQAALPTKEAFQSPTECRRKPVARSAEEINSLPLLEMKRRLSRGTDRILDVWTDYAGLVES
jgi:hypothetical protein